VDGNNGIKDAYALKPGAIEPGGALPRDGAR
jgi:hypothetical protein